MNGYIGHTDHAWWQFLKARPDLREVDFWRPGGGRRFLALKPGEPFFFRLKAPTNRIGGFGLFARNATLPVWRAWEVFGQANGVENEDALLVRLARLARRPVGISDEIGCIAVAECVFFDAAEWVEVPDSFRPQNVSGSLIDLGSPEGRQLMGACLERALTRGDAGSWVHELVRRDRRGEPYVIHPRLGQGSFRLAVMDAYGGACALTGEHSLPALEAGHIRPWSAGGRHELQNGLPLRRDVHRLFDLGYVSVRPDGRFLVSPRLRTEFANGETYYAFAGEHLRAPVDARAKPAPELLEWHSETVYLSA